MELAYAVKVDLDLSADAQAEEVQAVEVAPVPTHLVFVYGSLKLGYGNHPILGASPLRDVTRTVSRNFTMVSLGGFPGVELGGSYNIEGEVYEVTDEVLARLDRLESNGSFYQRYQTFLANGDTAWMYCLLHPMNPLWRSDNKRVKNLRNHSQNWLRAKDGNW